MQLSNNDFFLFLDILKDRWGANIQDFVELEAIKKSISLNQSSYTANKIIFKNIDLGRNVRPKGKSDSSFCELSINLTFGKEDKDIIIVPFSEYTMSIKISSTISSFGKAMQNVKSALHIDRDEDENLEFRHPEYHLHFGGKSIVKDDNFQFGNFLLLEAPRIMHPPLDIILSIDFIIHNFYNKEKRAKLVGEKAYVKAVANAKRAYWIPYGLAFVSHCDNDFEKMSGLKVNQDFKRRIFGSV